MSTHNIYFCGEIKNLYLMSPNTWSNETVMPDPEETTPKGLAESPNENFLKGVF